MYSTWISFGSLNSGWRAVFPRARNSWGFSTSACFPCEEGFLETALIIYLEKIWPALFCIADNSSMWKWAERRRREGGGGSSINTNSYDRHCLRLTMILTVPQRFSDLCTFQLNWLLLNKRHLLLCTRTAIFTGFSPTGLLPHTSPLLKWSASVSRSVS